MIIKNILVRISIIFILVIVFPLVQKQWLNLYLFDINNFSVYKILYYLSGLICPTLVIINSLNQFTFYKFNKKNITNIDISGISLLLISSSILIILSALISTYIFINLRILINLFINDNNFLVHVEIDKQILFVVITSIFLLFKKSKVLMKKVSLINFLITSIIIWYIEINNIILNNAFFIDFLKFENKNFFNILFILSIEIFYYLWSYISYGTYLSDWILPRPDKKEVSYTLNIIIFYFLVIIYYSILLK